MRDGFELTFTAPVERKTATPESLSVEAYTYDYGSPEVDLVTPKLTISSVGDDGKSFVIKVEALSKRHVHAPKLSGLRNEAGKGLLHTEAYYTLNEIASVP